jgi:hypothetical protein
LSLTVAAVLGVALALLGGSAWAEGGEVPAKFQAILFKKILAYDRAAGGRSKILVVFSDESSAEVEEIVKAFGDVGLSGQSVKTESLGDAKDVTALYVMPKSMRPAVREFCTSKQLLSMTGNPSLVERGEVAVGLEMKPDGRPGIVVHLKRVREEARDLSADLLGLARVVK